VKTKLLLLTFIGGALGSVLRYLLSLSFELSTWLWIANLVGSLVLGYVQANQRLRNEQWQNLIAAGFAGGFTTMSSLIVYVMLGNDPNFYYLAIQIVAGVAIYWFGRVLGGARQ